MERKESTQRQHQKYNYLFILIFIENYSLRSPGSKNISEVQTSGYPIASSSFRISLRQPQILLAVSTVVQAKQQRVDNRLQMKRFRGSQESWI